jgi:hypothetical protein
MNLLRSYVALLADASDHWIFQHRWDWFCEFNYGLWPDVQLPGWYVRYWERRYEGER